MISYTQRYLYANAKCISVSANNIHRSNTICLKKCSCFIGLLGIILSTLTDNYLAFMHSEATSSGGAVLGYPEEATNYIHRVGSRKSR